MSSFTNFLQKHKLVNNAKTHKPKRRYSIFEKVYFDEATQTIKTRQSLKKKVVFFGLLFCCTVGIPTYHAPEKSEYYY